MKPNPVKAFGKLACLSLLLSFVAFHLFAQTENLSANLVQNPSFETSNDGLALNLRNVINRAQHWSDPTAGGSLLYTTSGQQIYDPNGGSWPFTAHSGQNVAGINVYGGGDYPTREYIQGALNAPLTVGKTYTFSFWVHYHCEGANNIGIAFLEKPISTTKRGEILALTPVAYQEEVCKYKKGRWEQVEGKFVAVKPYQHFVIGNFFSDADTKVESRVYNHYFAYIDDVEVLLDEKANAAPITISDDEKKKWDKNDVAVKELAVAKEPEPEVEDKTAKAPEPVQTPAPKPEPVPMVVAPTPKVLSELNITKVTFALGSSVIIPESQSALEELATQLKAFPNTVVELAGYTCSDGENKFNQELSLKRAQAVSAFLLSKGVNSTQLVVVGFGEEKPLVPNDSEANKRLNRRVELSVLAK
ncbi:MAG: OmpA family protein [Haliscomenobacter sp.]|uniref:OmpA family protein n=1 Tax=Haliscomenobacter sp. TaxID=2717303 RepID=UPI0029AF932F|nr:OmpA family protein [Haliscomenobacter sp.]MDX2070003.1 OmpA family protein [Haliscomenobacter sp.]